MSGFKVARTPGAAGCEYDSLAGIHALLEAEIREAPDSLN
jgi:hypothetical protein